MTHRDLPLPPHFNPHKVGEVWKVPYQQRAEEAEKWAQQQHIPPAAHDRCTICLVAVDVQNTFCIPGFELFVGGRSGTCASSSAAASPRSASGRCWKPARLWTPKA